jgi:simple sugar transport system ATP-binding protein
MTLSILGRLGRRGKLGLRQEQELVEHWTRELGVVTASPDALISTLSGGNQQKVVVAREFSEDPRFLIASQPTRGLDVGAIEFVHKSLVEKRDQGVAILLVSAELDEIMELSDRIAVLYEGEIMGMFESGAVDENRLGLLMTGGEAQLAKQAIDLHAPALEAK